MNASGAMLLLSLVQVSESISGSVVPLAMFKTSGAVENFLGSFDDIIQQLLSYSHILGFPTKASDKFS